MQVGYHVIASEQCCNFSVALKLYQWAIAFCIKFAGEWKACLACVSQASLYEDFSNLDRDLKVLIAVGIPRHLFKILTDNDDIDLKSVTQYLKAVW